MGGGHGVFLAIWVDDVRSAQAARALAARGAEFLGELGLKRLAAVGEIEQVALGAGVTGGFECLPEAVADPAEQLA